MISHRPSLSAGGTSSHRSPPTLPVTGLLRPLRVPATRSSPSARLIDVWTPFYAITSYGDYDPNVHKPGFLAQEELLPKR
ncbi:NF2, moesin-ezrin-radixin like (MERLIN) tumor suppressor a, partial [Tachysurus ichikawai]